MPQSASYASSVQPVAAPAATNDNFANATVISALPYADSVSTTAATTESTDPTPSCGNGSLNASVWYRYTPTTSGQIIADTYGTPDYVTIISAWTGSPGALVEQACQGNFSFTQSQISFVATAGTTYYFMVTDYVGSGGTLVFHLATPPANDNFASATAISSLPYSDTIDTSGATSESTDPTPGCGFGRTARSVWYRFTTPSSGMLVADTLGSAYNTILSAWTGSPGAFTQVTCNDDYGSPQSQIAFAAAAGTTYSFMISSYTGSGGGLAFHVVSVPPASNDNFAAATTISTTPFSVRSNTTAASTESSDPTPSCGNNSRARSVWFRFTPSQTAAFSADTFGSNYDTILSVWTGAPGSFFEQACNDEAARSNQSQVSLTLTAGATYFFMVTSYGSTSGLLVFHLESLTPPSNDAFANALDMTTTFFGAIVNATSATTEGTDPVPACGGGSRARSVWFKYTPGTSGGASADIVGTNYDGVISVWTGSPGSFVQQACDKLQVVFPVTAGTTYYFMVSYSSGSGSILYFSFRNEQGPSVTWVTPPPSTIMPGTFSMVYRGASSTSSAITHLNVHYGTNPDPRVNYSVSTTGAATSGQTIEITETRSISTPGVYYFVAHATLGGVNYYSPVVSSIVLGGTPSIAISSVSPSSVTLVTGAAAQTVTVTIARNSFTDSVALSVSNLPAGVTASITQPGTGNSGSIVLQAAANASVVSGQSVTLTASGIGVASAPGSLTVNVTKPSSIAIGASPSAVTLVTGGSSQTVTVTLTRTNFAGSVDLSLSSLPSGVTSTITQPGTGGSGSIILLAASNASPVSNQTVTITASGAGVSSATASFSLTVTQPGIAISASPNTVALVAGGSSQTVAVTVSRTAFLGSVDLALGVLPTGVTSNITQPGTSNSGSIVLQAAADASLVNAQSITITASGSGIASPTAAFSLTVVSSASQLYLVGDAYPRPGAAGDLNGDGDYEDAGEFGDGSLTILDLIFGLRAVTSVTGYRPPACADRFDAMDAFPADSGAGRGGDGTLGVLDLIITLRRVTGVDASRPTRASRGLACPEPPPVAAMARTGAPVSETESGVSLSFGTPRTDPRGAWRVPIYLQAREELWLAGFSYALGLAQGEHEVRLRFVPGSAPVPSLVDNELAGVIAMAWLDGLRVEAGRRLLLGFIELPGTISLLPEERAVLQVYGAEAAARAGGERVPISFPRRVVLGGSAESQ